MDQDVKKMIEQLCSCLEDMATEKGGWAWEEVIAEAKQMIEDKEGLIK